MTGKEKINDIQYLIMEHYSDQEPLTENQKESKKCFIRYCDEIKKDLEILEILKKYEMFNLYLDSFESDKRLHLSCSLWKPEDEKDIKKIKEWLNEIHS